MAEINWISEYAEAAQQYATSAFNAGTEKVYFVIEKFGEMAAEGAHAAGTFASGHLPESVIEYARSARSQAETALESASEAMAAGMEEAKNSAPTVLSDLLKMEAMSREQFMEHTREFVDSVCVNFHFPFESTRKNFLRKLMVRP